MTRDRLLVVLRASLLGPPDSSRSNSSDAGRVGVGFPGELSASELALVSALRGVGAERILPFSAADGTPYWFSRSAVLAEHLHRLDRARLPAAADFLDRVAAAGLREEAIVSACLDGATTTRSAAKELLRSGRAPADASEGKIVATYRVLQETSRGSAQPWSPDQLRGLHRELGRGRPDSGGLAGRFRREGEECREEARCFGELTPPAPSAAELPARAEALCAWANGATGEEFLHPVLRALVTYLWLQHDRLFPTGNGRLARVVLRTMLRQADYAVFELTSLSSALASVYADQTRPGVAGAAAGDLTECLCRHAQALVSTQERLATKLADYEKTLRAGRARFPELAQLNLRQQALLLHAHAQPAKELTIEAHRASHAVVYQTARTDLLALAARGFLQPGKRGKALVFRAPADLERRLRGALASPTLPTEPKAPQRAKTQPAPFDATKD